MLRSVSQWVSDEVWYSLQALHLASYVYQEPHLLETYTLTHSYEHLLNLLFFVKTFLKVSLNFNLFFFLLVTPM